MILRAYLVCLWSLGLTLVSSSIAHSQESVTYGGVEIGAGGIKAVTIIFDPASGGTWKVSERRPKDFNPQLESVQGGLVAAGFTDKVVADVVDITAQMLQKMEQDVDANRRFVVISSGVIIQAQRLQKLDAVSALEASVKKKSRIQPERISVAQEVEFALQELTRELPPSRRQSALLVDIGSGNTKFGAYQGEKFAWGEIPRGAASELKAFKDLQSPETIQGGIAALRNTATRELRDERQRSGLQSFKPQEVYLLGGAVFSMMGYCQSGDLVPANEKDPAPVFANIKPDSLEVFRTWIKAGSSTVPDLGQLTVGHRERAEKRAELSRKVVSVDQRKTSLALIESVYDTFEFGPQATVRFPVDGQYSWIRGYVFNKAQSKQP